MQLYELKLYEMLLSWHTIIQIIIINSQSDILVSFLSVSATNYYHGELFVHDFFHMVVSDLNILAPDKA